VRKRNIVAGPRAPKPHLRSQHLGLPVLALGGRPRELRTPRLLLNQSPSQPCYATGTPIPRLSGLYWLSRGKKSMWYIFPILPPPMDEISGLRRCKQTYLRRFGHIAKGPRERITDEDLERGLRSIQRFAGLTITGNYIP